MAREHRQNAIQCLSAEGVSTFGTQSSDRIMFWSKTFTKMTRMYNKSLSKTKFQHCQCKVAVTYQRMSSAYACVWRLFVIRCHTLMHVGSTSGGGWASVQSTVSYALARRSSLRTPRNFMHAQKLSAYADVRPVRREHAMHTLCERSARPRHGRRTLTERQQYADVGGHKMCRFHDESSACW